MKTRRNIVFGILTFTLLIGLSSCSEDMQRKLAPVPVAYGTPNLVSPVMDQEMWEGVLGDTFQFYFSSAYLILPQPESIFDLQHYTPQQLISKSSRKNLPTYIIMADLEDESSPTTRLLKKDISPERLAQAKAEKGYNVTVGRNKWAKDQLVIYVYGYGRAKLVENIQNNFSAIIKKIQESQKERLNKSVFVSDRSNLIETNIKGTFGINMRIPSTFQTAMNNKDDFMWIRDDDVRGYSKHILIHKFKYTNKEQLTREGFKKIRNKVGRYITSEIDKSYMVVNDEDLPLFVDVITLKGKFALEAKGIWELENDFMGGAFYSYLIHDADKGELLLIDGFIHAPGKKKRDQMQRLEHVVKTVSF